MSDAEARSTRSEGARRFGPMSMLLIPALLAAFVLPSALNVNQSNPSPTLEYAPVPASDENPPPTPGNLDTLALASTTGLKTSGDGEGDGGAGPGGGGGPGLMPPPLQELVKRVASTKTCVGSPPRQTEDPTSPPCVGSFKGDNGGSTYQGVTRQEVKVLIYTICCSSRAGKYYDLAKPANGAEDSVVTAARVWQQYFNQRFQTYNRFVHFYLYPALDQSAEAHRAAAAQNYDDLKPFAVLISAQDFGPYVEEMARRGVMSFTGGLDGSLFLPASLYSGSAPKAWGNYASAELKAKLYTDYVCTELKSTPTSFRDAPNNNQKRKFALWFTTDPTFQDVQHFGEVAQELLERCGIPTIPKSFSTTHSSVTSKCQNDANAAVADWMRNEVTTVLHVGALEPCLTRAASTLGWDPEIVIAGDHFWEGPEALQAGQGAAIRNAVLVTDVPSFARRQDTHCITAFRDTDPKADDRPACFLYYPLLQVFTGIQVAGPALTPKAVDIGFHAIPAVRSNDPAVPACFYLPGDYTCTKDVTIQYWDQTTRRNRLPQDQGPCWRQVDAGARFIPGTFPKRDQLVGVDRLGGEGICNNSTNSILLTDDAA